VESAPSELSVDRTLRSSMTPAAAQTDSYSAAIEVDAAEELNADSAVPCFDSNIVLVLPKCTAMYRELVQKYSRLFRIAPALRTWHFTSFRPERPTLFVFQLDAC